MSTWQAGETTQADILRLRWKQAEEQRDLLAQAMWDARTTLGFDPDGDHGFHSTNWEFIAKQHVEEAQEVRDDYERGDDEDAAAFLALTAERDNAVAELLALKELAAEMCSAWKAGETSERTGAAHAALEQAVWVPGATHATYTCADCGHQWTTDWAVATRRLPRSEATFERAFAVESGQKSGPDRRERIRAVTDWLGADHE